MYSPYNFSATSPKSIIKVKVSISEKVNFLVKIFHCDCWLWFINYRTFSTTPPKHCFLTNSKLRNILCWGVPNLGICFECWWYKLYHITHFWALSFFHFPFTENLHIKNARKPREIIFFATYVDADRFTCEIP